MSEFIAGATSGIVQSLVGHPFDTIKVLIQTNKLKSNPKNIRSYYNGAAFPTLFNIFFNGTLFELNSKIQIKTQNQAISGFLSGLALAPPIFFFDIGKIHFQTKPKSPLKINQFYASKGLLSTCMRESISTSIYMTTYFNMEKKTHPVIAGGMAGLLCWTLTYPIDVIKTRQMCYNMTIKQAFNQGNLWKGLLACNIRAVLVNGFGFWAYDIMKRC